MLQVALLRKMPSLLRKASSCLTLIYNLGYVSVVHRLVEGCLRDGDVVELELGVEGLREACAHISL